MGLKDLENFLNDEQGKADKDAEIFDKRKRTWLRALACLYEQIENWLRELPSGMIKVDYEPKRISEDRLGEYQVEKMILTVRTQKATLEPIGTLIFGSRGRVDLIGKNGTIKFVLVSEDMDSPKITITMRDGQDLSGLSRDNNSEQLFVWKIASSPPHIRYQLLDKDSFSDAIMMVVR